MQKKEYVSVYTTRDYSIFKMLDGNRKVDERHVQEIVRSIKKNGLMPTTIYVNQKMEIIDGQHRFSALKRLGLPITYRIIDGLDLKSCIALNVAGRNWATKDFVKSNATIGNAEYKKVAQMLEEYPEFSMTQIGAILAGNSTSGGRTTRRIEDGEYRTDGDIEWCRRKLEALKPFKNMKTLGERSLYVVSILYDMNEAGNGVHEIDLKRLQKQLEKYGRDIRGMSARKDIVAYFQEIYNYKYSKERVLFRDAYDEYVRDTARKKQKEARRRGANG